MKSIGIYIINVRQAALSIIFLTVIAPAAFGAGGSRFFSNEEGGLEDSVKTSNEADSSAGKTRAVFFGLTYGNNSSYLGRYQTEVLPYFSADMSYKSKTGFSLSLFTYDINKTATWLDEVDVMAGWSFDLSKRVDASVFYTRFFFNESTELIKASVQNTASASLGLDWSYLYSKITTHYIFGDASDIFLVFDNSRYFESGQIFHKGDYLSVEPKISIIAGTQTFVDTHFVRQGTPLVSHGAGHSKGNSGSGSPAPVTTESSQTTFDILSYEFSLPVAYNIGKFSFEATGRYSIPVNLLEGDPSVPQFFFTAGVVCYISSK